MKQLLRNAYFLNNKVVEITKKLSLISLPHLVLYPPCIPSFHFSIPYFLIIHMIHVLRLRFFSSYSTALYSSLHSLIILFLFLLYFSFRLFILLHFFFYLLHLLFKELLYKPEVAVSKPKKME
jgi:hypothetical protein